LAMYKMDPKVHRFCDELDIASSALRRAGKYADAISPGVGVRLEKLQEVLAKVINYSRQDYTLTAGRELLQIQVGIVVRAHKRNRAWTPEKRELARVHGRKGGSASSEAKTRAARENAKKERPNRKPSASAKASSKHAELRRRMLLRDTQTGYLKFGPRSTD